MVSEAVFIVGLVTLPTAVSATLVALAVARWGSK
jgi:hypothetical protein